MTTGTEATRKPERAAWLPSTYLGWLAVATAFAGRQSWLERTHHGGGVCAHLTRILAAVLLLGLTAPWLVRTPGSWRGAVSPWRVAFRVRSIIAVVLAMTAALTVLVDGGVKTSIVALSRTPATILVTIPMLAFAEEVYFREALPAGFAAVPGGRGSRGVRGAVGSQLLYAVAHLPVLLLAPAPRLVMVLGALLRESLFGLLLLTLAGGPSRRIERVLIHSVVNLSIAIAPPGAGVPAWRGPLMCLVGGIALQLARWRAWPPPDYTPAWQRANDAAFGQTGRRRSSRRK